METNSYREGREDEKKDIIKIVEEAKFKKSNEELSMSTFVFNEFIDELIIKEINNPKNKSDWVKNDN